MLQRTHVLPPQLVVPNPRLPVIVLGPSLQRRVVARPVRRLVLALLRLALLHPLSLPVRLGSLCNKAELRSPL